MVEIFENIRKIYEFSAPCSDLKDHIEFFSESSADATKAHLHGKNFTVKMFPSWTPTIYLNLGSPYSITVGNENHFVPCHQDILILRDTIVERHNAPTDHIFTIKFLPGSLEQLLNIAPTAIKNSVTDLQNIFPLKLIRQLKQANSFDERVMLIERFLLMQLKAKQENRFMAVRTAIATYTEASMQPGVEELAGLFFVSSKTFNRNFHRVIGTSPKTYFSIVRARIALTNYTNKDQHFSPSAFGYFDMSHFYKDVFAFTGQKLTDFTRCK